MSCFIYIFICSAEGRKLRKHLQENLCPRFMFFPFDANCAVFVFVVIVQLLTIKSFLWHEIYSSFSLNLFLRPELV